MFTLQTAKSVFRLNAIPVYQRYNYKPANLPCVGVRMTVTGTLHFTADQKMAFSSEKNVFLCTDQLISSSFFFNNKTEKIRCILTTKYVFLDFYIENSQILLFQINPSDYQILKNSVGDCQPASIMIDMQDYYAFLLADRRQIIGCRLFPPKDLVNRMEMVLSKLCDLYKMQTVPEFDTLYFKDKDQIQSMTGMKTTFAYKNKLACLYYSPLHWQCEAHELTHILLYDSGEPIFLFQEGLAEIAYDICKFPASYTHYRSDLYIKRFQPLSRLNIKRYFLSCASFRKYDGWDYIISASFVLWLYKNFSMDVVLTLYTKISRSISYDQKIELLWQYTNMTIEDMESRWKKSLNI